MRLFAAVFARRAVEFRREAPAEATGASSHAERVSISEDAHAATQGAGRPAVGDVRWYRAFRGAAERARIASANEPLAGRSSSPASARPATLASATARTAIAAYQAGMALGAP